jgi:sRNA-binding protein
MRLLFSRRRFDVEETDMNQTVHTGVHWPAYRRTRTKLAEMFPAAIPSNGVSWRKPLKVGIKDDLMRVATGGSAREIFNFLAAFTSGPKYLRSCTIGAARVDLRGRPCGTVMEPQARHAVAKLEAHDLAVQRARGNRAAFLDLIDQQVAA